MLTLLVGILTVASVENESAGDKTGIDTGEGHAIEESGHQTALKFVAAEAVATIKSNTCPGAAS
ncbi:MAG: hypothetical protein H6963_13580 [Chromatiaceae bacterium]|nr:hypothetical protein [Chromatiaceae bacterium]